MNYNHLKEGMTAYSKIQQQEFAREKDGYTSVKHQREVGTSYFDAVSNTISSGQSSTTAMTGSTESNNFKKLITPSQFFIALNWAINLLNFFAKFTPSVKHFRK